MTTTLCIETSGPHCSLAVAVGEHVFAQQQLLHRSHNARLLPMLDELLKQAGVAPRDIELIGFGCGPGSFTGVRIAAAAVQALAMAAQAQVVPVSSSWIMASTAFRAYASLDGCVTAISSRGQAYYLAAYELDDSGKPRELVADELCDAKPQWLAAAPNALVGDLPAWLEDHYSNTQIIDVSPSAEAMINWVREKHAEGLALAPEFALPRYIEGDSPWRKQVN